MRKPKLTASPHGGKRGPKIPDPPCTPKPPKRPPPPTPPDPGCGTPNPALEILRKLAKR